MRKFYGSATFVLALSSLQLQVATGFAQSIQLSWIPNHEPDVSHYNIYRKCHPDSVFTLLASVSHPESTYLDTVFEWNAEYLYKINASDSAGNESDYSNIAEMTTLFPALGRIKNGDESHLDEVRFSYNANSGDYALLYQVYDIDTEDEVEVLFNGAKLHNENTTANLAWSDTRAILLPAALRSDSTRNEVSFVNSKNKYNGKRLYWGVRAIREAKCLPLPFGGEAGRIRNGSSEHVNEVCFTFEGQSGDLSLAYEVFDIDHVYELDILLNGTKLHDEAITADNSWSNRRTLLLPDALVRDTGMNLLIFENSKNPPNQWFWGVRNLEISTAATIAVEIDSSRLIRALDSKGDLHLSFSNEQKFDYALLYPEESEQHFFSYRLEVSSDARAWHTLLESSEPFAHGPQLVRLPDTHASFLRIRGLSYDAEVDALPFPATTETAYWQAWEQLVEQAPARDLAIFRISLFQQRPLSPTAEKAGEIPDTFLLLQNFPNPFNPTTTIRFELPEPSNIKLIVYNAKGEQVHAFTQPDVAAGYHQYTFDGTGLATGIYLYRLEAGSFNVTRKMMLAK